MCDGGLHARRMHASQRVVLAIVAKRVVEDEGLVAYFAKGIRSVGRGVFDEGVDLLRKEG